MEPPHGDLVELQIACSDMFAKEAVMLNMLKGWYRFEERKWLKRPTDDSFQVFLVKGWLKDFTKGLISLEVLLDFVEPLSSVVSFIFEGLLSSASCPASKEGETFTFHSSSDHSFFGRRTVEHKRRNEGLPAHDCERIHARSFKLSSWHSSLDRLEYYANIEGKFDSMYIAGPRWVYFRCVVEERTLLKKKSKAILLQQSFLMAEPRQ